jgi:serine kinase of HPr protein (carbohydrate metabolism regulator)
LTGSTVHGILQIPIPTVSTKAKHGRHLKSIWTTAASWFSNTPKKGARASRLFSKSEKTAAKKNSWQSGPESYVHGE